MLFVVSALKFVYDEIDRKNRKKTQKCPYYIHGDMHNPIV